MRVRNYKPEIFLMICVFMLGVSTTMLVISLKENLKYLPELSLEAEDYSLENITSIEVEPFTINYMPLDQINELWKTYNITKYGNRTVLAFNDLGRRQIYISLTKDKDINGEYMPDLCTLGHEVYHNEELGGLWHD